MTTLTRVITSHNLKEIERLIFDFPTLILEKENGWLPIEWAEKTGNVVTFTRTARVINYEISSNSTEKWLTKYLSLVTATEYESLPKGKETEMIWESVFEGALFKVDRWQRLLRTSRRY